MLPWEVVRVPPLLPEPPEFVPLGTLLTTVMVTAAGSVAADAMENKNMEMGGFIWNSRMGGDVKPGWVC